MPDGRLLHLRDTYPIETAWAPQYVGDELRQVRAAAREARLAGLRASAEAAGQGRDLAATQAGNPAFPLRTRTRRRPRRRLGSRRLTAVRSSPSAAAKVTSCRNLSLNAAAYGCCHELAAMYRIRVRAAADGVQLGVRVVLRDTPDALALVPERRPGQSGLPGGRARGRHGRHARKPLARSQLTRFTANLRRDGMPSDGGVLHRRYSYRVTCVTLRGEAAVTSQMLDVSLHERRRDRRMQDPQYRAAYEQAARELAQTDAVIQQLDSLRADMGISKAELARRVNRNASSVRRLFTASQVRPELPLIAALADALGAELRVVPLSAEARRATREHGRHRRVAATG
jgi:ribosome-binding protein aMBF1 (putative translation factor)